MRKSLKVSGFLRYGMRALRGKMFAGLLMVAAPACAEPVTILAFGDSLTQGYGLVEKQGFVPQLQRWLDASQADAELINGGVSGRTMAGGAAGIDWALTAEVDAVIVALGGNDMLRGIDPANSRANLTKILKMTQAAGVQTLLVGLRAPGNYGAEYKAAFDAIFVDLAAQYGTLYAPDFFAGLRAGRTGPRADYFQPDGIHPNAEGVALIIKGLGPHVLALVAATRHGPGDGGGQ